MERPQTAGGNNGGHQGNGGGNRKPHQQNGDNQQQRRDVRIPVFVGGTVVGTPSSGGGGGAGGGGGGDGAIQRKKNRRANRRRRVTGVGAEGSAAVAAAEEDDDDDEEEEEGGALPHKAPLVAHTVLSAAPVRQGAPAPQHQKGGQQQGGQQQQRQQQQGGQQQQRQQQPGGQQPQRQQQQQGGQQQQRQQQLGAGGGGGARPMTAPIVATHHHHHESSSTTTTTSSAAAVVAAPAATVSGTSGMDQRFLSSLLWTDPSIAPLIRTCKRAIIEVFKFGQLSKVQAATFPLSCAGADCFGKAKTGGGKTLSFLIPTVEKLVSTHALNQQGSIGALVIAPTRELAMQILEEAKNLTRFHPGIRVMSVIGGTNINGEKQRMTHRGGVSIDILVGTPGRLVDHVENTAGFKEALGTVSMLVLDEADRLLDMGFKPQLDTIGRYLRTNNQHNAIGAGGAFGTSAAPRQTLLFSATVPAGVTEVAKRFLRPQYSFVDTVGEDEQTNVNVAQECLVVQSHSLVPALARILSHAAIADPKHKIIVFFPTARTTGYMAGLFERMGVVGSGSRPGAPKKFNIIEMHSRKSQGYRTSASEKFRVGSGIMMFSSDVTARGMDYPDVTQIIQVGLTDREQYIHRLGRTARAGKSGAGLIVLADYEANALLPDLQDLPITYSGATSALTGGTAVGVPGVVGGTTIGGGSGSGGAVGAGGGAGQQQQRSGGKAPRIVVPVSAPIAAPLELSNILRSVQADKELLREAKQCYSGWLGFYNTNLKKLGWDKTHLVQECNSLFMTLGLVEIPMMSRETLGKMSLRGTPGLNEAPKGWRPGAGEE